MTGDTPRRPAVFEAGDPRLKLDLPPDEKTSTGDLPVTVPQIPRRRGGWRLGAMLLAGLGALVSLGVGLAVANMIEALFARADWLGYAGLGAAALVALAVAAILIRELIGLARLGRIAHLRADANKAAEADDRRAAHRTISQITALYRTDPETARGRAELAAHRGEIIDGRDLLKLAEKSLLTAKDAQARAMILNSAKRVTAVTAISPRAVVDVLFVLIETVGLVRRLATVYGGRPSGLGMIRLIRMVTAHLALTGSIALTDGLVQQLIGHGMAARLSARLGEGVVNGLLTARIGLAALDVCRPLPYLAGKPPALGDILNELTRIGGKTDGKKGD